MSKTDDGWTQEELLRDLESVAEEIGRGPTLQEYRQKGTYPTDRFYSLFESWSAAKECAGLNPNARPNAGIDSSELLDDIKSVADKLGRSPSSAEYVQEGKHSLKPVYRQFDSWGEALEQAGLEVLNFESVTQRIGESELLQTLKEDVDEIGHVPTRDEYNAKGTYTDTTFANYFGGWNEALREAGFEVNKELDTHAEIQCAGCGTEIEEPRWKRESREYIFCSRECMHQSESFTAACSNCSKEISTTYVHVQTNHRVFCDDKCRNAYYRKHPSKGRLYDCDNCGKEIEVGEWKLKNGTHTFCSRECSNEFHTVSEEQLIAEYKRLYTEIGRHPTVDDIIELSKHGLCTYYKNFSSLCDVADEIGVPKKRDITKIVECQNCNSEIKRAVSRANDGRNFCDRECYFEWMRAGNLRDESIERPPNYGPNWYKQRSKARERDNNTCQSCGMTSQEHKEACGMDLHVHHITPWHEFDDYERRNRLENLITLCADCHQKWESLPIKPQVSGGEV